MVSCRTEVLQIAIPIVSVVHTFTLFSHLKSIIKEKIREETKATKVKEIWEGEHMRKTGVDGWIRRDWIDDASNGPGIRGTQVKSSVRMKKT
jgi:hypothetical protein